MKRQSANTRAAAIRVLAIKLGLEVDSNRPGDGTRRFIFTRPNGLTYSCVGASEAEAYLYGYQQGTEAQHDLENSNA